MADFTKDDRELLVRTNQCLLDFKESFDKFKKEDFGEFKSLMLSDTGPARCAARAVKWEAVEKHMNRVNAAAKWVITTIAGGVIIGCITLFLRWIEKLPSALHGLQGP